MDRRELLDKTRRLDLECGTLCHATHGLVLYRQRVFGATNHVTPAGGEAAAPAGI
ncbi:MAG: hypothetical protein U0935_24585 [Pirellulales bacterium]